MINIDDVPDEVRTGAYRTFDLVDRTLRVADISFDSLLDSSADGVPADRELRFESPDRIIELRVTSDGEGPLTLHVSVTPPIAKAHLAVRRTDSQQKVRLRDGQASFQVLPGLVSILVERSDDDEGRIATAWVRL